MSTTTTQSETVTLTHKDPNIILGFSALFIVCGIVLYLSYKNQDSLRTKSASAIIDEITNYDVTYTTSYLQYRPTLVPNVELKNIKNNGDSISFQNISTSKYDNLPISSVTKVPSKIKVTTDDTDKITASIFKADFTRNIEDTDVGKKIDIEFDPNNLTNISMAVDGLSTSQIWICSILIIIGLFLLGLGLYLKFSKK